MPPPPPVTMAMRSLISMSCSLQRGTVGGCLVEGGRNASWLRSAARARGEEAGDLLDVEPEDLVEHLEGVLAEARGREAGPVVVAADPELVALVGHLAHLGMLEAAEERSMRQLRVLHVVARALHHASRDTRRLQQ